MSVSVLMWSYFICVKHVKDSQEGDTMSSALYGFGKLKISKCS